MIKQSTADVYTATSSTFQVLAKTLHTFYNS